jgi:hypothetical protein
LNAGHGRAQPLQRIAGVEPNLEAAHDQSFRNRPLIENGGACGCFYCLKTFDASEVVMWVHDDSTALCPHCGIDAVLSSKGCSIAAAFLHSMHARWFKRTVRLDLSAELKKFPKSVVADRCFGELRGSQPTSETKLTRPIRKA